MSDDPYWEPPDDPRPAGYCAVCGEWTIGVSEDFGYGYTECGSHGSTDVDEGFVSSCCEAEIVDEQPEIET